ncbi:MAG: hypothetical protein ACTHJQ_14400 [Rhizobiaceae bacterium]
MKAWVLAAVLAISIGGVDSAGAMEISRDQCESIRRDLVATTQTLLRYRKAVRQMQVVAMDMVLMRDFLEGAGGDTARQLAARLTKDVASISAVTKDALSMDAARHDDQTFVKVCGQPPRNRSGR